MIRSFAEARQQGGLTNTPTPALVVSGHPSTKKQNGDSGKANV